VTWTPASPARSSSPSKRALSLPHRAYELGANVTPYDATYVALAEHLDCPLLTADGRLAAAPGLRCAVRLLAA
jgi:predicted nucleic acid-binding protein